MLDDIARLLQRSERILFITGAGISADSGLPTYRGFGGLYEGGDTSEGYAIEEVLSGGMLAIHPEITWKYLRQIENHCRGAEPNAAHRIIAEIEREKPGTMVLTQNIDGLHRAAGSQHLVEIHGNLHRIFCSAHCGYGADVHSYAELEPLPLCPRCAAPIRPAVVLFGERLPEEAVRQLCDGLDEGFDLVFSIGTSSLFPYIVEPVLWASYNGVPTVEINPSETRITPLVNYAFKEGAASAMEQIRECWLDLE
ncbi:MAG: NAD-dependent deacylase [Betaproteobacteria bacterium]|nr:NAD-dependent deacylase [Betaproteobacteria bacterium]